MLYNISWELLVVLFEIYCNIQFDNIITLANGVHLNEESLNNLKLMVQDTEELEKPRKIDVREFEKIPGVKWKKIPIKKDITK